MNNEEIMNPAGPEETDANYANLMSSTTKQSDRITQLSPQEEALQALCKQLLKSRIFRGFYLERRFVQPLESYRDVISLQRAERELEKILIDLSRRLQMFYAHSNSPNIWIGVTNGPMAGTTLPSGSLETYIWVELDDLAFGQYWFSIKSIRFREKEIIIKLKMIREVEDEITLFTPTKQRQQSPKTKEIFYGVDSKEGMKLHEKNTPAYDETQEKQINFNDFIEIIRQWGTSIKQIIYEFMSKDINRENIKGLLKFMVVLAISLISGALAGIKFLGIFTLRFMFEFNRFTHVMTPIILKIIETLSKIVGGFFILIAMIWRDTFGKKIYAPQPERRDSRALRYDRPLYLALKYDVRTTINKSK